MGVMRDIAGLTSRRAVAANLVDSVQARFHQNRQKGIATTHQMWYNHNRRAFLCGIVRATEA